MLYSAYIEWPFSNLRLLFECRFTCCGFNCLIITAIQKSLCTIIFAKQNYIREKSISFRCKCYKST